MEVDVPMARVSQDLSGGWITEDWWRDAGGEGVTVTSDEEEEVIGGVESEPDEWAR